MAADARPRCPRDYGYGHARPFHALEAIRRGAYDYILKPFEKTALSRSAAGLAAPPAGDGESHYQRNLEQAVEERTAKLSETLEQLEQSYTTRWKHGRRAGLEGRRDGRPLPARNGVHYSIARRWECRRRSCPHRARGVSADIGKMAIPDSILRKPGH